MDNFFTSLRENSLSDRLSQSRLSQGNKIRTEKQSMSLGNPTMLKAINDYHNAKDWNEKLGVVNTIMKNNPNPDDSLKKWVNALANKAIQERKEHELIDWAVKAIASPQNVNNRDQIVNYLMEYTYTNQLEPSDWYVRSVKNLQDLTDKMRRVPMLNPYSPRKGEQ